MKDTNNKKPDKIWGHDVEKLDYCVISAHPDDADLTSSGLLMSAKKRGQRTGVIDLTRGEMGTRGTVEDRRNEAKKASELLELDIRLNFDLGDGRLEVTYENSLLIARTIRQLKPTIIIAPYFEDRHPDHIAAHYIVTKAMFLARMKQIDLGLPIFSPRGLLFYAGHKYFNPDFVVDITDFFERKMAVVRAFYTQFGTPLTNISNDYMPLGTYDYCFFIESRARQYGTLIRRPYGEGFKSWEPLKVQDPIAIFKDR